MNKIFIRIVSAVIIINVIGVLLRLYEVDTYIFLAGFRFHLGLTLPFLFVITGDSYERIKIIFKSSRLIEAVHAALWSFGSLVILCGLLFLLDYISIADPEYFYEFGISSTIDFPIYLIWNLPALMMFGFFLFLAADEFKNRILIISLLTALLFAYELIPLSKSAVSIQAIIGYIFFSAVLTVLVVKLKNIFLIVLFLFTFLWGHFLLFGTNNKLLVNLLFAKNYPAWEGFLGADKLVLPYLFILQIFFASILIFFSLAILRKKNKT